MKRFGQPQGLYTSLIATPYKMYLCFISCIGLHSLGLPTCLLCESAGQSVPRGKRIMTCQRYGAFKRHCTESIQVCSLLTFLCHSVVIDKYVRLFWGCRATRVVDKWGSSVDDVVRV